MDIKEIEKLETKKIGKKIEYYKQIGSTHTYAKSIANKKENDGKVIIAEIQTEGIGTKGRKWHTGDSKNIAMTIILFTNKKVGEIKDLPIQIAKVIKNSIKNLYNYDLELKKPNDLMLNGKKICGILTQLGTKGEDIQYVLISMGFNVNENDFSRELKNIATSLKNEYKKDFKREEIIKKILEDIEKEIEL